MPYLSLLAFDLKVSPSPQGIHENLEEENNLIHFSWFQGLTTELTIQASSLILLKDYNPLGFLVYPAFYGTVPFQYSDTEKIRLYAALIPLKLQQPLINFGETILKASNSDTVAFLLNLTKQIKLEFEVRSRDEGPPRDPDTTFQLKEGSCRDLAWMQIHLLRHFGIASRFVSGYYYIEPAQEAFDLHAWVEIFLPGAGWMGADPSNGMLTTQLHIPIVSSAFYEQTMPVSGTTRGEAKSVLKTEVTISTI